MELKLASLLLFLFKCICPHACDLRSHVSVYGVLKVEPEL
jgi:hypothetical protein